MLEVDIKKNYENFKLDAKFTNEKGILGILGASGSGKSLTLKAIAGIIKPDYG
ncbi:MAG: ATP-binding cassette domain-containing protein, partial [Anaerococcus sp.]|nr:ATP-binding cassette domain-containing protein [Anaerococcus sp.]